MIKIVLHPGLEIRPKPPFRAESKQNAGDFELFWGASTYNLAMQSYFWPVTR